jgi:hypothetical protein
MNVGPVGPWREFTKEIEKNGHQIVNSRISGNFDALIANNHSTYIVNECKKNKVPKSKMIIILWEPKTVDWKRHSRKSLSNYGTVFSPSLDWAIGNERKFFNWPQLKLAEESISISNWSLMHNRAVMILSNKFSATKGELYTLRRQTAFITSKNKTMDIFGDNWNSNMVYKYSNYFRKFFSTPINLLSIKSFSLIGKSYSNYLGISANKVNTSKNYRIIVVIENSLDYISEKLFDAYSSPAIVIYVGADINKYGIPKAAAIQVSANANAINSKIIEIQNLPIEQQFILMQKQRKAILSISNDWYGNTVLNHLAKEICNTLSSAIFKPNDHI